MKNKLWLTLGALCVIALASVPASAQCYIGGNITAEESDSDLGDWCYTLEVMWDTGDQTSLSHLNLVIDLPTGTCECYEVVEAISFGYPAGSSDGYPDGCMVDYEAWIECNGDPSIPIEGILIKWEPLYDESCEPGPTGTGYFMFYSDYSPVPVDESLPVVVEKNAGQYCEGTVTGVFPGLPCNPVSAEATTWSQLKSLYER